MCSQNNAIEGRECTKKYNPVILERKHNSVQSMMQISKLVLIHAASTKSLLVFESQILKYHQGTKAHDTQYFDLS